MNELRVAGMFYEQRGPLVFSASLHLVLLVGFALWALTSPEKKPEELVFEIVEEPAGGFAPARETAAEDQPMQPISYQSVQVDLPTPEEIVLPERPMIPVQPPPVVVEQPQPLAEQTIPVEKPKPKPKPVEKPVEAPKMTLEEFQRQQGQIKVQNVRTQPQQTAQKIDLTADLNKLKRNLSEFKIEGLSSAQMSSNASVSQDQMASYLSRFRAAVRRSVERHPIAGSPLRVTVRCNISGGGHISNVSVVSSSGDPVFDRKVVDAFRKIRIFDAPPDNVGFNGISFELVQE